MNAEQKRQAENRDGDASWDFYGPYLAERAWATVREDYSETGEAWDYFPHDHARSRVYRWNEDGLAGISDKEQRLCFSLALWNGHDAILKERLFGLTGQEGNHGEDVKESYFYLDSTPTHSYMRMLYKYPQAAFPYLQLIEENRWRGKDTHEYELLDTGVFEEDRYFDVFVEYAKAGPQDLLVRISAVNRGPDEADLHLLPTLWYRNTWGWGYDDRKPVLSAEETPQDGNDKQTSQVWVKGTHHSLKESYLYCDGPAELLFTENETNTRRLYGHSPATPYVKDGINDFIVNGDGGAINTARTGTKMAAHYPASVKAGGTFTVCLRLTDAPNDAPFEEFEAIFKQRQDEADEFYTVLQPAALSDDERLVQRQAFAGMLWSKQFYYYDVNQWLKGDPSQPAPPAQRKGGRNWEWAHLNNADVISMPDKWEYPWFAAWDLAFHCIPLALVDSQFAKNQLDLLTREWYQHPNGAVPAYEWAFGDVNPPVLAWSAWRVYKIEEKEIGKGDRAFLESIFHKLLMNFTWWVNRKDAEGKNVFQGGFLGLDNIGIFDRSAPLPTGGFLEQSDGTSWMGMYSLNMMKIALELACTNPVYENISTKFFEHFLSIAAAMSEMRGDGVGLWDETDEFFYDNLKTTDGRSFSLKVRSLVGLIPLLAVETIEPELLAKVPGFKVRLEWFLNYRPDLANLVSRWNEPGEGETRLLALVRGHRMKRLLSRMLDPDEFLGDYGIRSISKFHEASPYMLDVDGTTHAVAYEPAESGSGLFGGNSNWRGPIWFPINYLLIESLQKFHHYYGEDFKVECPTGSGRYLTLREVADELSQRLIGIFKRDEQGHRPFNGVNPTLQTDPNFRDYILFNEYFHGDNGAGLGASHQTGWTGLVAKLIQQQGESQLRTKPKPEQEQ